MTLNEFKDSLTAIFQETESMGLVAIEVNSGNLHRRVGGYPGTSGDHRMPMCCDAMYSLMGPTDSIISQPDSGKGASVIVRYTLPRSE